MALSTSQLDRILTKCEYNPVNPNLSSIIVEQINEFMTDSNEAAMFLAQLIHESGGFQHSKEIGGGAGHAYGTRYYGRGFIQLTWEDNYRKASQAIYGDDRLVRDPDSVSNDPELSMRVSVWYWEWAVRPAGGPRQNKFGMTTKAINPMEGGPSNTAAQRRYGFYLKAAGVLRIVNLASDAWW